MPLVGQLVKNPAAMQATQVRLLVWEDGGGKGYPLQYSGLESSMDYMVHGVTKRRTRLSDFHFHCRVPRKLHSWAFILQ